MEVTSHRPARDKVMRVFLDQGVAGVIRVCLGEEVDDTDCVRDGEVWPEHDFPPGEIGNECRRCGAEAEG